MRFDGVRDFFAELWPVFECVPVARHEGAVVSVDVGERGTRRASPRRADPDGQRASGSRGSRMGRSAGGVFGRMPSGGVLGAGTSRS